MSLATMPGKIRLYGSYAVLVMTEGNLHQTVCISNDAMPAGAGDMIQGILRYLHVYESIADRKFSEGQLAYDGRVWITASDMTLH
ncbi:MULTISPECIES: hypothetical protein [unclassified Rhizobium]|uniref:hypothetical protein n=1 Tax=unclassified Rhizobium TaxID=2613769 RepID=UPI0002715BC2|nr:MULTISPECIES: hypothetical protein [unclassified Rhizobium]EJL58675.1 hypothetical protein PMI09_00386 [Rhizobium sp. CF122]MBB3399607.1 hypothetical protein [Rhizobium sp. BK060]MBB4172096.1 hypothetical protein [Rhizobium sp. BK538]TCM63774.1 hypothetical protein EV291_14816 [Rhizobium sp. BK068]